MPRQTSLVFSRLRAGRTHSPRKLRLSAMLVLGALIVAGCGGSTHSSSPPPNYKKDLAGSPPPLASLYAQGNKLLPGGKPAFDERIDRLNGFPIVVNIWGSWCGPCIQEFPLFQKASAKFGKKVAFVGVNSEDSEDLATDLLQDYPIPYPSYIDQDNEIFDSLVSARGLPATVFFDREGSQTFAKRGGYADEAALERDIRSHAIEGSPG